MNLDRHVVVVFFKGEQFGHQLATPWYGKTSAEVETQVREWLAKSAIAREVVEIRTFNSPLAG